MRISIKARPQHTDWPALRDLWREADRIDLYQVGWTFDHFTPISGHPSGPCLEGWMLLPALAVEAPRLRLGVMVSSNTHRHPALLANMAATLDQISGGRLEIGLGAGWNEDEHLAYGIQLPPLRERFDRLEEACQVLHLLLTEDAANFEGRHYTLREARCEPKPLQRPRPPLVIGGRGEHRTLRIAARFADQWNYPDDDDPADFRHKLEVLQSHCLQVPRDPAEIEVSVQVQAQGAPGRIAERAASFVEAGARHIVVWFSPPFDPGRLATIADALAAGLPAHASGG